MGLKMIMNLINSQIMVDEYNYIHANRFRRAGKSSGLTDNINQFWKYTNLELTKHKTSPKIKMFVLGKKS